MEFLGQFHPQIVHMPIALLIFSVLFDLAGRALDSDWWRKASLALLVIGVLAGVGAILSGEPASERAEEQQGIPEATVEHHEDVAKWSVWIAGGALLARLVEIGGGPARGVVGALALVLQLCAAVAVGIAGHRGGALVYEHGANVKIGGQLIRHTGATPAAATDSLTPAESKHDTDD